MALPTLIATPAAAQTVGCLGTPGAGGPTPILQGPPGAPIVCVNNEDRVSNATSDDAINLTHSQFSIFLNNSGNLTAADYGIFVYTTSTVVGGAADSSITILNASNIQADVGIFARTRSTVVGGAGDNSILIDHSGAIQADEYGIRAIATSTTVQGVKNGAIEIQAAGSIVSGLNGIYAESSATNVLSQSNNGIVVNNNAQIQAGNSGVYAGIAAFVGATNVQSSVTSPPSVVNAGGIVASGDGIDARAIFINVQSGGNAPISITNPGAIRAAGDGIDVRSFATNVSSIVNGPIAVNNAGVIVAGGDGIRVYNSFTNIDSNSNQAAQIVNSGDIQASTGAGIYFFSNNVNVQSSVDMSLSVLNSGSVRGGDAGIYARSQSVDVLSSVANSINIQNAGSISANSGLAIDTVGPATTIFNSGLITGFVDLTDNADLFVNQSGGVFQASGTSLFGLGDDLFTNEVGGLVDTANNAGVDETVAFQGLETFRNFGTISLLDGAEGDLFTISNTPGGTDLEYEAGSFLAVDAFLGGPGSRSDIFRIDGNVSGVTDVLVTNTNPLPGTFNPDGITVVQVRGDVDPNAFRLANGPIDTGFFNFDLFFEPRNGGAFDEFELRSFPGGGAFLLPQLITASQDIWHQTNDTWFDRSADLRTQLWRNGVSGVPGAMYLGGGSVKDGAVIAEPGLSPAVWAKVSHRKH